jgi:hypothetical protein
MVREIAFEAVDLAFDDALAVRQDQAGTHGDRILRETSAKADQIRNVALAGSFDPAVQSVWGTLGKQGHKVLREMVSRLQVRMDLAKKRAHLLLGLGQLRQGTHKQPHGLFRREVIIRTWR